MVAEDGIKEVYINLKAKVTDKKLKSLFKIMTTVNEVDSATFPILSKKKEEINKLYIGGENNMSGISLEMYKDGLKEGREEGSIAIVLNMFKQKIIDLATAANVLKMSETDFLKLAK